MVPQMASMDSPTLAKSSAVQKENGTEIHDGRHDAQTVFCDFVYMSSSVYGTIIVFEPAFSSSVVNGLVS